MSLNNQYPFSSTGHAVSYFPGHAVSYVNMLYNGSFDYSWPNAKLSGLGIFLGNAPLRPDVLQRFRCLLSHMWQGLRFSSTSYEIEFPAHIDPLCIVYEYHPTGHVFDYQGCYQINRKIYNKLHNSQQRHSMIQQSFITDISKENELKTIFSFISSGTLQKLSISEGVHFLFKSEIEI